MKRLKKAIFLLAAGWLYCGFASGAEDIALGIRLYQGILSKTPLPSEVTASFYLQNPSSGHYFSDSMIQKEKDTLVKEFQLADLKLIIRTGVVLSGREAERAIEVGLVHKGKFDIRLERRQKKDGSYRILIRENSGAGPALLDAEIILPENRPTVLGFRTSQDAIYFIALNRMSFLPPPPPPMGKRLNEGVATPRLLYGEAPVYPDDALEKGIQGEVILEVKTDASGQVSEVRIKDGPPIFAESVRQAVKNWKYEIHFSEGIPRPVRFETVIFFRLGEQLINK